MAFKLRQITLAPAAGGAEVSTSEGVLELHSGGRVIAVRVAYGGGGAAGTEVTCADIGTMGTQVVKLTGKTDKTVYPLTPGAKSADGSESGTAVPFAERLQVKVAKANVGDVVTVTALVEL